MVIAFMPPIDKMELAENETASKHEKNRGDCIVCLLACLTHSLIQH